MPNLPDLPASSIAGYIDNTVLALDATEAQIDQLCAEARKYHFATVCVRLNFVRRCVSNLKDSGVGVGCAVGFHEGTYPTASKVVEAKQAIEDGAAELDMVINYEALKRGGSSGSMAVSEDIKAVRAAAPAPITLKCILETSQLCEAEIYGGAGLAAEAGADFVKTSTGFKGRGATVQDLEIIGLALREFPRVKIKASGGIRRLNDLKVMVKAGAARIGTTSGVAIMEEALAGRQISGEGSVGDY